MTEVCRSLPCARPQAVTVPRYFVWAMALASVWLPTESTTAPQRSFWNGLPGSDSSLRLMKSSAPSVVSIFTTRDALQALPALSERGVERLLHVYGGRAAGIAAIAGQRPELCGCIDAAATLPAAEIAFVIAEELPRTLTDIVYRRMMIGLDADQGRPHYAKIAELAAAEFGWDANRSADELRSLHAFSDSLRVGPV